MAIQHRLFDPADYADRVPSANSTPEKAFRHYLEKGCLQGEPPSSHFNAFLYSRYDKHFRIGFDEPVLHALMHGFQQTLTRRWTLYHVGRPHLNWDIATARQKIRNNQFSGKIFQGDLHMIVTGKPKKGDFYGWDKYVSGTVYLHPVAGNHNSYLKEYVEKTATTLQQILTSPHMANTTSETLIEA